MKLLILGAGSSMPAGYPGAAGLMDAVAEDAGRTTLINFRQAWEAWERFREETSEPLRRLLRNPNPEVVLSVPDLLEIATAEEDERRRRLAFEQWQEQGDEALEPWKEYLGSAARAEFAAGRAAALRFHDCLHWYFAHKSYADAEQPHRRDYLRELLRGYGQGDVVITFNWDTTVERTVMEEGTWSPVRGYGISRPLVDQASPFIDPQALPEAVTALRWPTVLKLHGSFGWHRAHTGEMYFESALYLRHLPLLRSGSRTVFLRDPAEPPAQPPGESVLAYPSFLKQLHGEEMQEIWCQAVEAVAGASEVDVFGYSLPPSDAATRVLLNPLRARSADISVRVTDPDRQARERWQGFLGEHAQVLEGRLG
jgi:hypothetical protein